MKKSVLLGVILVLLMFSSTLVYFLSPFFQPSLPEDNIVEYELSLNQKNMVLRQGRVLMEFFYGNCENCTEKISFLESIADQYKDKTFLEKIFVNETTPKLHLIGFNVTSNGIYLQERLLQGEEIVYENVMNNLCDIMIYPPVECARV
ncbi:MAG: hypothetical protein QXS37_01865 [Candidatus Aenigmatarchaeota archaeon]